MNRYITQVREMLLAANIRLGPEYTVEFSHHYGVSNFAQFGATIINLINREYCKKVVVVLPGQVHPMHYHKLKEETFQVLWGSLHLHLGGTFRILHPGDMILIERNAPHRFTANHGGCIFEEISTTHIPGDSYYEDDGIMSLTLDQRKTTIQGPLT